jgi:hypothetical protein
MSQQRDDNNNRRLPSPAQQAQEVANTLRTFDPERFAELERLLRPLLSPNVIRGRSQQQQQPPAQNNQQQQAPAPNQNNDDDDEEDEMNVRLREIAAELKKLSELNIRLPSAFGLELRGALRSDAITREAIRFNKNALFGNNFKILGNAFINSDPTIDGESKSKMANLDQMLAAVYQVLPQGANLPRTLILNTEQGATDKSTTLKLAKIVREQILDNNRNAFSLPKVRVVILNAMRDALPETLHELTKMALVKFLLGYLLHQCGSSIQARAGIVNALYTMGRTENVNGRALAQDPRQSIFPTPYTPEPANAYNMLLAVDVVVDLLESKYEIGGIPTEQHELSINTSRSVATLMTLAFRLVSSFAATNLEQRAKFLTSVQNMVEKTSFLNAKPNASPSSSMSIAAVADLILTKWVNPILEHGNKVELENEWAGPLPLIGSSAASRAAGGNSKFEDTLVGVLESIKIALAQTSASTTKMSDNVNNFVHAWRYTTQYYTFSDKLINKNMIYDFPAGVKGWNAVFPPPPNFPNPYK